MTLLKHRFRVKVKRRFITSGRPSGHHQAMLDNAEMGRRIKAAIDNGPMTQAAIAAAFGVTEQAVSGWIRTGKVDKRKLPKLASLTGVPLERFMPGAPPSQPAGLDLEMLKSAIVAVKESLRKAELELDAFVAAPVIAFAYQERIKLPRDLPKARLREFDQQIWEHLQGELAHDSGQGRAAQGSQKGAEIPAPSAKKAGGRKA